MSDAPGDEGAALRAGLSAVFAHLPELLLLASPSGQIVDVNPSAANALGWSRHELTGQSLTVVTPTNGRHWWNDTNSPPAKTDKPALECRLQRRDGTSFPVDMRVSQIPAEHGEPLLLASARDLTERLRLEGHLRQATKMEAVGRLAGGVAHDFNNLLTVILTYSRFLTEDLDPSSTMLADVHEIQEAARRAAALTHRLLAFSRRQMLEPEVLDWTAVVLDMLPLLRRLIGEDLELTTDLDTNPSLFVGDPGQLSQVLMNLVVNARDAMPQGGNIVVSTRDVHVDASLAATMPGMRPGTYATLEVQDTGCGMNSEVLARLFEPFFTTKHDGTGLGLAMVYGIVKQSDGFVYATTVIDQNSVFCVFMPVASNRSASPRRTQTVVPTGNMGGDETILLVEDEDLVRNVATRALDRAGFRVLSARNAGEALLLFEQHGDQIDLLLSDVVMPHMGGGQLAERLLAQRPSLPVLFMTGYTDDAVVRHGVFEHRASIVHKPFTPEQLVGKARETLDAKK
jgi:PAS domain S-box-containing protein